MQAVARNFLAVLLGLIIGSLVNIGVVMLGSWLISSPPGVDTTSTESLMQSMHLLGPRHFIFPFLGHALGTFSGALAAFKLAANHPKILATMIGTIFLAGGVAAASMIPAPTWFIVLDLVGAYLPMAWLGVVVGGCAKKKDFY
jgi:hypothetical protein